MTYQQNPRNVMQYNEHVSAFIKLEILIKELQGAGASSSLHAITRHYMVIHYKQLDVITFHYIYLIIWKLTQNAITYNYMVDHYMKLHTVTCMQLHAITCM